MTGHRSSSRTPSSPTQSIQNTDDDTFPTNERAPLDADTLDSIDGIVWQDGEPYIDICPSGQCHVAVAGVDPEDLARWSAQFGDGELMTGEYNHEVEDDDGKSTWASGFGLVKDFGMPELISLVIFFLFVWFWIRGRRNGH